MMDLLSSNFRVQLSLAKGGMSSALSVSSQIAHSSSINPVGILSARITKPFPRPRCASATEIVRAVESTAETQPELQPRSTRAMQDGVRLALLHFL